MDKPIDASCVSTTLSLSDLQLQTLLSKLDELGVEFQSELKYVVESDLLDILKPVHIRKLLSAWNSAGTFISLNDTISR